MVGQGAVPAMVGLEYNCSKHKRHWLTGGGEGWGVVSQPENVEYTQIPPDSSRLCGSRRVGVKRKSPDRQPIQEPVVAEYVVEFGKDGRPTEPDGRLDAPAF